MYGRVYEIDSVFTENLQSNPPNPTSNQETISINRLPEGSTDIIVRTMIKMITRLTMIAPPN